MKLEKISKKNYFLGLGIIILVVIIGSWFHTKAPKSEKEAVLVQAQAVKISNLPEQINAVGTLSTQRDIFITPEVSGNITEVSFNDGQAVKKGDALYKMDNTKEQADLLSAQADYEQIKNKYNRMQELVKPHYVSAQDLDAAHAELQAKLGAVKTAQDNLNKKSITAPFDGALGASAVGVGNYVVPGQKLVRLVDRSLLRVAYSIPEKYLLIVKLDQPVSITTADAKGKQYSGKVVYIAPAIDTETHTLALQASIPNVNNELAPGLFVQTQQIIRSNQAALLVPEEALVKSPEKTVVFRVDNNKAMEIPVTLGASQNGYVEITSGLKPTDRIITAGQQNLSNGDLVRIVPVSQKN